jgi:hypothetical protein
MEVNKMPEYIFAIMIIGKIIVKVVKILAKSKRKRKK